ncbi:glycosyltransferase family 61 protein [Pedobacter nyackensis]|uniref:glycosyltransferase family 61 protein n=1 Tax=Pedobacter nyackensis TaxID=475255 RepID=UPI00292E6241|nr:glycosyltransferase family 61 protein [Pedobacter nyackensis]
MNILKSELNAHLSIRKRPANYQNNHEHLFKNAFQQEINQTTLLNLKKVNILKGTIFNVSKLKSYPSLSSIQPVSKKVLFKKIFKLILPQNKIHDAIWINDDWSEEYFHWLTDALTRLITIGTFTPNRLVILPESYKTKPYISQSLELLKFEISYYNPRKRLVISNLYTCTHTAPTGNYNKHIINNLRDRFLKDKKSFPTRKIFISRQKATRRKIQNENQVISLVSHYGYEIHFFEDYDFLQQIAIMSETKSLIGLHGAGLTNMLFMPCNGQVMELRNEGDNHNNCFFSLASDLGHDYFYLLNTGNTENTHLVEVTVNIPRLKEALTLMEV